LDALLQTKSFPALPVSARVLSKLQWWIRPLLSVGWSAIPHVGVKCVKVVVVVEVEVDVVGVVIVVDVDVVDDVDDVEVEVDVVDVVGIVVGIVVGAEQSMNFLAYAHFASHLYPSESKTVASTYRGSFIVTTFGTDVE